MNVEESAILKIALGRVRHQRVIVTHKDAVGKTLGELGLDVLYGVTVTRVTRAYVEVTAVPALRLHFGDMVVVVGEEANLAQAAHFLGNSVKAVNETNFIPIFVGIALGVMPGRCRSTCRVCRRRCGWDSLAGRSCSASS